MRKNCLKKEYSQKRIRFVQDVSEIRHKERKLSNHELCCTSFLNNGPLFILKMEGQKNKAQPCRKKCVYLLVADYYNKDYCFDNSKF